MYIVRNELAVLKQHYTVCVNDMMSIYGGGSMVICLGQGADLHMAQLISNAANCLAPGNPDRFWFYLSGTGSPG